MENQLTRLISLFRSMGFSYWAGRIIYELKKRTKWYRLKFPVVYSDQVTITKEAWINSPHKFFIPEKSLLTLEKNKNELLQKKAEEIFSGHIRYFNGTTFNLGTNYDWLTDPVTGYRYNHTAHWTEIKDFPEGRDIKYVWEKSRFCYLYTIIRYDYHFETDCSGFVFNEINSWIDHAQLNCGPNYLSSQEIGLRIMNWCFFMSYYQDSDNLSEHQFQKITGSIYHQAQHIYHTLEFSRKFVRNNHILTEAAALITVSILFPSFPESGEWRSRGLSIFVKEIDYQIYGDGTYLQYSMNYNRVVVQLLSWVIALCKQNGIKLSNTLIQQANKTVAFLYAAMNRHNGMLPNYGNNDGSLFLPLSDQEFRDYRPQLQALNDLLSGDLYFEELYEETLWFRNINKQVFHETNLRQNFSYAFPESGYYFFHEQNSLTFLRCGNHHNRPSQADNLHLDIWFENKNLMRDAGTFQYNGEKEFTSFYFGTRSHNTIQIGQLDQMLKGPRFIWYYRTNCLDAKITGSENEWIFNGSIRAFRQTGKWIIHKRQVIKKKNIPDWEIVDTVSDNANLPVTQIWNPSEYFYEQFEIFSEDENGRTIPATVTTGYFSETYGVKKEIKQILFITKGKKIKTNIRLKIK